MSKRQRSPDSSSDHAADKRPHWSLSAADNDRLLYAELPAALVADEPAPTVRSVPALVSSLVASDNALRSAQDKIEHKHLLLETAIRDRSQAQLEKRAARSLLNDNRILSNRQLKRRDFTKIDRSAISYDLFQHLNQIWVQYFDQVTNSSSNREILQSKLVKTDLHGAVLGIVRSRNPGLIGERGIVFKETQYTFEIVTKSNATKVIPKQYSVFGLVHRGHILQIFGNNFLYRPSERSVKKYKAHGTSLLL